MARRKFHFHNGRVGSALAIKVVPESDHNELKSILDDGTLVIHLEASPMKGEVNLCLTQYLVEILDVNASSIEIFAGDDEVDKIVAILGVDAEDIENRIMYHW